jgi:TrpR-related protein YerC/YecD
LLFDLVSAFTIVKSPTESALFIQDLLTKNETKTLAKRLRIAKLLLQGKSYEEVQTDLHTSFATIAKVGYWLERSGEGFRTVIKRLPQRAKPKHWTEYSDWDKFKRHHSLYFWPELLLEEIVKSASRREKERLQKVLDQLDKKSSLHQKIQELLGSEFKK